MTHKIAILGSTGSIGTQTLDVISQFPNSLSVVGLSAGSNISLLKKQIETFSPKAVAVQHEHDAVSLQSALGKNGPRVCFGEEGNNRIAGLSTSDIVVVATPGLAGIGPTITAVEQQKTVALATKEVLVSAGKLVTKLARKNTVQLLPIDSEHSAIFQCLEGRSAKEVARVYLTCSGGPFRGKTAKDLKNVTPKQALSHPNWSMGRKISIDSATLMNKGFEVIEAMWLFGLPLEKIKVVVHPQSVVHSAVEFVDGTIIAQLGPSDMRLPIQYALLHPQKRQPNNFKRFSFVNNPSLTFEEPDLKTFRCLDLAFQAAKQGGSSPIVLTAANDIAVEAFLVGKIPFLKIADIVEHCLENGSHSSPKTLQEILAIDAWARQCATNIVSA